MKIKIIPIVMLCVCLAVLCACTDTAANGKQEKDLLTAEMQEEGKDSQRNEESHGHTEADFSDAEREAEKDGGQEDDSLEEELEQYRQKREDGIQESSGAVVMTSETGDYAFLADLERIISRMPQFDTKETGEAYAASESYVEDVLEIQPPTKNTVYMCVDPRMAAIYEDDDKGVASGYANDQIFITEYCDGDGVWQYLVLVRDGKEEPWKVIHNGRSYKE